MAKNCKLLVELGGQKVNCLGSVVIEESASGSTRLQFTIEGDERPECNIGDEVSITVTLDRPEEETGTICLYVSSITTRGEDAISSIIVVAEDPLASCDLQRVFVSRVGGRDVGALTSEIVSENHQGIAIQVANGAAAIDSQWLLQANETGREFLVRVCGGLGTVLYWNRDALDIQPIGRPPFLTTHQLIRGDDYWAVEHYRHSVWQSQRTMWVDRNTRSLQTLLVERQGGAACVARRSNRVAVAQDLNAEGYLGRVNNRQFGESRRIQTFRPDIRVGDAITWGDGQVRYAVTEIQHIIEPGGQYENWVTVVPEDLWAVSRETRLHPVSIGLVQAEVSENDDPARQQRIRVILSEDSERRPSHWIPVVSLAAGADGGAFWLPERGDLVLVHIDPATPELLTCLGAIRGESQKAKESWSSETNERKALFLAAGIGITFDQERELLRLETPGAVLELEGGNISIRAQNLVLDAGDGLKATAGGSVDIDGTQINLG